MKDTEKEKKRERKRKSDTSFKCYTWTAYFLILRFVKP